MTRDRLERSFRNLRVSLTTACNLSCLYCVPGQKRARTARRELSADQMIAAVRAVIDAAGIDRLRMTGGEPLIAPQFDEFVAAVMRLPLREVSLTTNGQLLERKAALLAARGVRRVNVSLDTLDSARFRAIARGGDLARVLRGIDRMLEYGIKVKVNMVPMRRWNVTDIVPMLDYCLSRRIELRFIELMRMGHLAAGPAFETEFVAKEEILAIIAGHHTFELAETPCAATALRYEIPGRGSFGIIANESEPFCSTCDRLRLSATGHLYGCISNRRSHYIGHLLGHPRELLARELEQVLAKALTDKRDRFSGEVISMRELGG